jgi:hypothetical protein
MLANHVTWGTAGPLGVGKWQRPTVQAAARLEGRRCPKIKPIGGAAFLIFILTLALPSTSGCGWLYLSSSYWINL